LGYDVDPRCFRLVVNEAEAERVRAIFALYLEHQALLPVVQELGRRGWTTKRWRTRKGHERGGQAFDRTKLYRLLTNVTYTGQVRYKDEVHSGEHPAIVDGGVFQRVQALLHSHGRAGGATAPGTCDALLRGLLHCASCYCAMTPSYAVKNQTKQYRYYVCSQAQKRGRQACPSRSVPAGQIEQFVVEQIRCIGRDPALLHKVLAQARQQDAPARQNWKASSAGWSGTWPAGTTRSASSPASSARGTTTAR
jgi:site-specific DNA recombinase